ncbi:segmentation protein cap'n'collar-like isoform X1 [Metopolophium dirhodum]|uniref:segmentation protein cap'n'collar-like isoform X1 n=2 Tax=Metopolophium dirhodum TaxID=44670 RepID=UPI00299055B0|nr:segmentation protein cap'n'collar-like isoform X1 [Metopolophium dirhodum]
MRHKKKIMLRIKKGFSEQLLQMALLLSLIGCDRLWPTFGIWPSAPSAEVEVGPFGRWDDDSYSNGFGPLTQIHPKSVDRYLDRQWLLNELLSLGRYGDRYPSNIEAYLLNVDGNENGQDDQQQPGPGGHVVKTEPKENDDEDNDDVEVFDTDIVEDVFMFAPEDAELVEALWKVDLDYGTSGATTESRGPSPYDSTSVGSFLLPGDEPPSRNYTFSSPEASSKSRWFLPPNSSDWSAGSSSHTSGFERTQNSDGNPWEVGSLLVDLRTADESRSRRASSDNDTETSDLDADDSAKDRKYDQSSSNNESPSLTPGFRVKESPYYEPSFEFDFDELESFADMMQCYLQPPPPSRHFQGRMGYTRTGNSGMDQRGWQELATCSPMLAFPVEGQHHHQSHYGQHPSSVPSYPPGPGMYHHPHHHQHNHHHHQHNNHNNTGNVLLQNVSLCAPPPLPPPPPSTSIDMGGGHATTSSSSSSLSHYHHHSSSIGVSTNCNLSSAVATSLHLPGSSSEQPAAFKTEPHQHEMMFPYQNHNNEMAPSSDGLLSSILNDDDLQLMDPAMGADGGMYPVRMMETASSSVPCNNNTMNTATMVQNGNAGGGDSDSAVSSMGSERVPSLSSDTEWMETNSDSGHNDGYPSQSLQEYGKMRWLDNYLYSGSRGHSAAPQKKYQLYGRRLTDPVSGTPNTTETARSNHMGLVPDSLNLPYDMSVREGIPLPSSSQFNRHNMAGCSRVMTPENQVALNHTYALPVEGPRIPRNKLKSSSKRSEDEQLTRDEKRARNLNIPITVDDIINLPMDEFNERLSKYDLSESQLTLIRDIRRRGKNKVAAQNCRKRKLDQILSLADEVKQMKDRKFNLLQEREYLMTERMRVKTKYDLLYNHIFGSLRDPDGNPYSPYTHTLREQPDGSVSIVPRNNGTQTDRNPRSKQHKDK